MLYLISECGGLLGLEQDYHHLPATSTNRGTIRQQSGIVQPRHHIYAIPYNSRGIQGYPFLSEAQL